TAFSCAENRRRFFIAEHAHRACKSPFSAAESVSAAGAIFFDFPTRARFLSGQSGEGSGTMKLTRSAILPLAIFVATSGSPSHADTIGDAIDQQAKAVEAKMIAWRRDIHQNPELGNREFRTSALVAEHLRKLGYEVRDKVAHTGVVAVLK